jgi:MFS family permease
MPATGRSLGRNVIALTMVSFFTDVSSEIIYPLLPLFLTGTLGAGATVVGLIEGAAETTASVLKVASGWWSDRVRRRKPLVVAGYLLASLARPLVAIAQSAGQVMAIRLTDRVGKGLRTSPRDALIADSVDAANRGRAFGIHRAGDHAGAVLGPLVAFALLGWGGMSLRHVFLVAAIPAAIAVAIVILGVKEPRAARKQEAPRPDLSVPLNRRFWLVLGVILLFTLGNSTDAFLILRARELGVSVALIPILWAVLHVVKAVTSVPGGALSDALGRRPLLVAGWVTYALIYIGFAFASTTWHAWALFAAYGIVFGLTEGTERALVADLVPADRRGTAYGWYNLAIGAGALPASLIFGLLWDGWNSTVAFGFGAAMGIVAVVSLLLVMRSEAVRA